MESPMSRAFKLRPKGFHAVGVDNAAHVFLAPVVDAGIEETALRESVVTWKLIVEHRGTGGDHGFNVIHQKSATPQSIVAGLRGWPEMRVRLSCWLPFHSAAQKPADCSSSFRMAAMSSQMARHRRKFHPLSIIILNSVRIFHRKNNANFFSASTI